MTDDKTWFITGGGRDMGVEFAKAARPQATTWWPPAAT